MIVFLKTKTIQFEYYPKYKGMYLNGFETQIHISLQYE